MTRGTKYCVICGGINPKRKTTCSPTCIGRFRSYNMTKLVDKQNNSWGRHRFTFSKKGDEIRSKYNID